MGLSHHFTELSLAIGSFGATAVLLHAVPDGALSQPRSFVGGHIISALVGMVVSPSEIESASQRTDNRLHRA